MDANRMRVVSEAVTGKARATLRLNGEKFVATALPSQRIDDFIICTILHDASNEIEY